MFYRKSEVLREIVSLFLISCDESDRLHIFWLSELRPIRDFSIRDSEYDASIFEVESRTEELTYEWSYLLRWEVHHSDDLFTDEFFFCIVYCDLRARLLHSDLGSEIYPYFVCRFVCFREVFYSDDSSSAKFY